jgi:hypothetical protein
VSETAMTRAWRPPSAVTGPASSSGLPIAAAATSSAARTPGKNAPAPRPGSAASRAGHPPLSSALPGVRPPDGTAAPSPPPRSASRALLDWQRDERAHGVGHGIVPRPSRWRSTSWRPAQAAHRRTRWRGPAKISRRWLVRPPPATASSTSPTGLVAEAPSGPATPVNGEGDVDAARTDRPFGHRGGDLGADRAVRGEQGRRDPQQRLLGRVRVHDGAAQKEPARSGRSVRSFRPGHPCKTPPPRA